MNYHDLSNSEKNEVEKAVHSIIISNENNFENDDSFFIEKLKKEGMIESSGKKLKW